MPRRGDAEFVSDIGEAIGRIERYTEGLEYDAFLEDIKTQDAVMRNLEIVGEAVKRLSAEFRKTHKGIRWPDIAGMRDRLIHDYFGVNWDIVWDVVRNKLPELKAALALNQADRGE
jgi:uncharacterized protein with HEPN domain